MKKIIICLMTIAGLFIGIVPVSAKDCSAVLAAPYMYQVTPWKRSPINALQLYTSQSTCYGNNTEVWYSSFKSLPDSWTHPTGDIWINLWEEDYSGGDDKVKEYVGRINNKVITHIDLLNVLISGAIDSVGDNRGEFYLTFVSSGTQGLSIDKSLFNYKVCLN